MYQCGVICKLQEAARIVPEGGLGFKAQGCLGLNGG